MYNNYAPYNKNKQQGNRTEGITASAPYNFVPFYGKKIKRYTDISLLPRHDIITQKRLTGEISLTIKADTPVFVSNGGENFFRDATGRLCIPGSTVRGLVRENMQILSFGSISPDDDIEDYRIYYRNLAKTRTEADKKQRKTYSEIIPEKVRAGYLNSKGSEYYITPIRGDVFRIPRTEENYDRLPELEILSEQYASTTEVIYKTERGTISKLLKMPGNGVVPSGFSKGTLLVTGRPVKSNNAVYVFPEADGSQETVPVSKEDITAYKADYESRANTLGQFKNFWKLPPKDKCRDWPVFFYVDPKGNVSFGRSRYLRIMSKGSIAEGLPHAGVLLTDYTHSIFGFATKENSYKSRVSFGDFIVKDAAVKELNPITMILGGPKPSFYSGYLDGDANYDDEKFSLRGYKQYWLKEPLVPPVTKENVACRISPVPVGTEFSGSIKFKNLASDELGLLLWSLLAEDGCYCSIGKGKPYGYGRVKISIDKVIKYKTGADALALDINELKEDVTGKTETYINKYFDIAGKAIACDVRSTDTVKAFFYMHSHIMERKPGEKFKFDYLDLTEFKKIQYPLPTVKEIMKGKY